MRIISKFHDYYDTALGHGVDMELVYVRETEKLTDDAAVSDFDFMGFRKAAPYTGYVSRWGNYNAFGSGKVEVDGVRLVAFCGIMHPVITVKEGRVYNEPKAIHCFSAEAFEQAFLSLCDEDEKTIYLEADRKEARTWGGNYRINKHGIQAFYEEFAGRNEARLTDWHARTKVPIAALSVHGRVRSGELVLNPCLADLEFYRVVDPYGAFQEVSMFMGGVIGRSGPSMVEISDNDRIAKHGFNEWSFRKPPQGRR